jgi:hypothetical protein
MWWAGKVEKRCGSHHFPDWHTGFTLRAGFSLIAIKFFVKVCL